MPCSTVRHFMLGSSDGVGVRGVSLQVAAGPDTISMTVVWSNASTYAVNANSSTHEDIMHHATPSVLMQEEMCLWFFIQVDGVVGQLALHSPAVCTAAALSAWAVGAACAGAADAIIASVLNGEAAALGCNRVSGL